MEVRYLLTLKFLINRQTVMNGQSEIVMIVYLKIEINKRVLSRVAISVYCMNNYEQDGEIIWKK